jgi:hypothetical protein
LKIQVTNYGSFEEMKGTSAIHGAMFFFIKRGMALRKKGYAAAPFYFSLD